MSAKARLTQFALRGPLQHSTRFLVPLDKEITRGIQFALMEEGNLQAQALQGDVKDEKAMVSDCLIGARPTSSRGENGKKR